MKKTIVVFGGTGGLGSKLVPFLNKKYNVISLGSKDVDVFNLKEVKEFFSTNDVDIVLNMAGKEYNTYLSEIDENNQKEVLDIINVMFWEM